MRAWQARHATKAVMEALEEAAKGTLGQGAEVALRWTVRLAMDREDWVVWGAKRQQVMAAMAGAEGLQGAGEVVVERIGGRGKTTVEMAMLKGPEVPCCAMLCHAVPCCAMLKGPEVALHRLSTCWPT